MQITPYGCSHIDAAIATSSLEHANRRPFRTDYRKSRDPNGFVNMPNATMLSS